MEPTNTFTIVYGKESYMPVPYQGFTCGPLSVTITLGPDETYEQAYVRIWPQLEALATKMFIARRNSWHERNAAKS